jgi:hypothetical protein
MTDEKDLGFPDRRKPVFRERGDYDEENVFTYHKPKEGQAGKYEELREHAKIVAFAMRRLCPPSRELSLARTNLEQAVFWANAAIARHGK